MSCSEEADTEKNIEIKKKGVFILIVLVHFVLPDYIEIVRLKYLHNLDFLNTSVSTTMPRLLI